MSHDHRAGAVVGVAIMAMLAFGGAAAPGAAQAGRVKRPHAPRRAVCRVPRLTGLVVAVARRDVAKAGCRLRLQGAAVQAAEIQTIAQQLPRAGQRGLLITAWVNPLCAGSAANGPPPGEPTFAPGPSELISGLFVAGGPPVATSAPSCVFPPGGPGPGTITITDPATGADIATSTVADGQLATFPLPPGTYTISGTFANATINGQYAQASATVTIPGGEIVRQDVTLAIP
jgi:hypothetical protein